MCTPWTLGSGSPPLPHRLDSIPNGLVQRSNKHRCGLVGAEEPLFGAPGNANLEVHLELLSRERMGISAGPSRGAPALAR